MSTKFRDLKRNIADISLLRTKLHTFTLKIQCIYIHVHLLFVHHHHVLSHLVFKLKEKWLVVAVNPNRKLMRSRPVSVDVSRSAGGFQNLYPARYGKGGKLIKVGGWCVSISTIAIQIQRSYTIFWYVGSSISQAGVK